MLHETNTAGWEGWRDTASIRVGSLNKSFSPADRSFRQKKIKTATTELKRVTDQVDLIIIYRTLFLTASGCTFLSATHETLSKRDHILGVWQVITNEKQLDYCLVSYSVITEYPKRRRKRPAS